MNSLDLDTTATILRRFAINGELEQLVRHDRGHIHDTFISTWVQEHSRKRYLHQRMNRTVFPDIPGLMHNVEQVTRHLNDRHETGPDGFHTLRLVNTHDGDTFLDDSTGPWRTYHFHENTESYDLCDGEDRAFEAARAFARFQGWLTDMNVEELNETIPNFFSSPHRFRQFEDAVAEDRVGRASSVTTEIEFARDRQPMVSVMEMNMRAGKFPPRVIHGDTKLNNVLFDRFSGKAISIIDLDTCMPSYSLYDFGDLVRFTAATCAEDETDLNLAGVDLDLYRALVEGYLDGAGHFLTREEVRLMPFSARLVTFTVGLRFLADYLAGDVYFKTHRTDHNLDRARVQFRMVERMEQREKEMAT